MNSAHAWLRTVIVLLAIPISFMVAIETQNIQTILLIVGILYVALSGGYLMLILRSKDMSVYDVANSKDLILRRGSTWILLVYISFINLLITETIIIDSTAIVLVYMGGVLDQVTLHWMSENII